MADTLFIGIDGGGTHCRARIRDGEGRVRGEGTGGPANLRLGPAVAMASIVDAAKAAAAAGGLNDGDLARAAVGLGMAGAIDEARNAQLLAQPHPFPRVAIDTDAYIAWLGAFAGGDGAILIIGTGSAGLAVVKGRRFNVGGWGNVVSDDGSGNEIGKHAIRRALWALDGMAPMTALATKILDRFDHEPPKVVTWSDQARPTDFAQLAPLVLDYAGQGDALGVAVIEAAAEGAARIADRLLAVGAPGLCLLGGLGEPLRPWLPKRIQERLVAAQGDAMEGALRLARAAQPLKQKAGA
ncbi:BadF/BadG/BcrA/BcrD ATPase family protein [Dongia sedimenti]|uniref:BadF/BadG/BcrA/BcrD ATPase family protein n=1 Tax=Dongia sedimenti TaxID=3064282 RepID=A0ABU0YIJ7_9PROT|nr:BadF/BadG/BcrA/BcrD ATPase family protein [Rhodospirillaceae bacterium R-7]